MTPAISATDVKRISPSGIMPIIAPTAFGIAADSGDFSRKYSSRNRITPIGTSSFDTSETSLLSSVISSDFGERMLFASRISLAA